MKSPEPSPSIPPAGDARDPLAEARAVVERIVAAVHDRPSLVSRIACDVGAEIVEGIRQPGDDLNSVDLSRRYKTSRTPVREALMLLEKERLVEVLPRRRPRVVLLGFRVVREIYRVRTALLELIAGDVARSATAEQIDMLSHLATAMQRACQRRDLRAYVWANIQFHEYNTLVAGNITAKRIIDSLLLRTVALRRLSLAQEGRMETSLADHLHLVQAYERREPNLAAALIRSNHMNALATLERSLDQLGTTSRAGEAGRE
jgi:DNA-binding GntR family transcriptional regulator